MLCTSKWAFGHSTLSKGSAKHGGHGPVDGGNFCTDVPTLAASGLICAHELSAKTRETRITEWRKGLDR